MSAQDDADRQALQGILPRAKSTKERRALEKMIAKRGGPPVKTCKCGQAVSPHSGELLECEDCYARAYGK